jgi:glutamate 5-kinase
MASVELLQAKTATINDSEQNMSSYHITRPVMKGELLEIQNAQMALESERQKQLFLLQQQINSEREEYNQGEAVKIYNDFGTEVASPDLTIDTQNLKFKKNNNDLRDQQQISPIKNAQIKVLSRNTSG